MYKSITLILILKLVCLSTGCSPEAGKTSFYSGNTKNHLNINPNKQENHSAFLYLKSVYTKTTDNLPESNHENHQLTSEDLAKIRSSDTVASFSAQKAQEAGGGKPDEIQRMWFDVVTIEADQQLVRADLRFFRDDSKTDKRFQGLDFKLTVFRVKGKKFVYVNSIIVDGDFKGWIVLNVTRGFQWWIDHTGSNYGFKITTEPMYGFSKSTAMMEVQPELLGLVGFDGDADKHAFAVGFYKGAKGTFVEFQVITVAEEENEYDIVSKLSKLEMSNSEDHNLVKRNAESKNVHDQDYENEFYDVSELNDLDRKLYAYTKTVCKLRTIPIRFTDIGLDFIAAPAVINLNDCIGKCRLPFHSRANATDHAAFKSLQSAYGITRLNKPSCTPIKYEDHIFFYLGSENTFLTRKFANVTASACGCR